MSTIYELAERYGGALGDVVPQGTGFVLLVFRPGTQQEVERGEAGVAYVTNAEAADAMRVLKGFLAMAEAGQPVAPRSPV